MSRAKNLYGNISVLKNNLKASIAGAEFLMENRITMAEEQNIRDHEIMGALMQKVFATRIEIRTTKECYRCKENKILGEFDRTKVPHVLRIKANMGRRLSCLTCQEKLQLDQKYFKLYEVPPKTVVDFNGRKVYFDHVDGMYSICYEEDGTVINLNNGVWVSILPEYDFDEILTVIEEKESE
jgi:hypothetical protein